MKNLVLILFTIFAFCFVACEDKDSNHATEEATCTPACVEGTECKCADNECKCEMIIVEECKCEDGTNCPEGDKDACETSKPKTCDPACNEETQDCLCDEEKCECRDKDAKPECKCEDGTDCPEGDAAKCAKQEIPVCDPECPDKVECVCTEEGCSCKEPPAEEPKCADDCNLETHDCVCAEDKCECKEKEVPVETSKCESACKDTEECVCVGPNEEGATECKCEEKKAEECFCDEEKKVACPEGGKDACEKAEPVE